MISYEVQLPSTIFNGQPRYTNRAISLNTLEDVKRELSIYDREYVKHARVWRLTKEEIDIDKEDW